MNPPSEQGLNPAHQAFAQARQQLLQWRGQHATAMASFRWPELQQFNWALDWFDVHAQGNHRPALWVVNEDGSEQKLSFWQMSQRSNQVAAYLRKRGVQRGDRILLMLPNVVPLWEVTLAAIKLGAVVSPATTLLTGADLQDRITRGQMKHVVVEAAAAARFGDIQGSFTRIAVGSPGEVKHLSAGPQPWHDYADALDSTAALRSEDTPPSPFAPDAATQATDPLLLYFTSGTTALPKMVLHTHQSYPVGHLSTMYWLGLREGDVHLNISSPGWGKHAWSSFYAPWNAGATIFIFNQARFDPKRTLDTVVRCGVSSLCAPPTVWRSLILEDLKAWPVRLTEVIGAGEPLNPEVIEQVRAAWGLTLRDGYGQTESTCMVGNPPGLPVRAGSMGQPMPGYRMVLLDTEDREADEGELAVVLQPAPIGLMQGYLGQEERNHELLGGAYYRTSDVARRDADGYFWYVGRADDVFKASDYRISPFELESALLEHPWVAEAAVVPSPDALKLAVPKAFVVLKPSLPAGVAAGREAGFEILRFLRQRLAPYKRVRRLEFADLPKTISGKIRRVQLRQAEEALRASGQRAALEFWEEDFPDLKQTPG
jgi:acetyl-CoA synthetase